MTPVERAYARAGAALVLALTARPAAAQVTAEGRQSLTFGVALPGISTTVAPKDAMRAGQFYLLEHQGGAVQLTLALPTQLLSKGGGALQINFTSTDGVIRTTGASATSTVFNPNRSYNVTLSSAPDLFIDLGGTIQPTSKQAAGNYTGTITLTITVIS